MNKLRLIVTLLLMNTFANAQLVNIETDKADVKIKERSKYVFAIHSELERDDLTYVATISGKDENIDLLYRFLKVETHKLKANFFEVTKLVHIDGYFNVEWKVYLGSDSLGYVNNDLYPWNEVYLFSQFNNARTFIVNGEEIDVPKASFIKFQMDSVEELAIQFGGRSKVPLNYHNNKYQASKFVVALSGSINFKVGRNAWDHNSETGIIMEIDPCDGWFLTNVYSEFIPKQ